MTQVFDTPITTNDASLDRVLGTGLPTLLLFLNGAPGAGMEETLKRLARENAGQLLVVKLPTGESPAAARRYQVATAPAIVTLRNGQVVSKAEGVAAAQMDQHAAYLLGKGSKPEAQPSPAPSPQATTESPNDDARKTAEAKPIVVTDATFARAVMGSQKLVLVDFWAPWCGPCRMVSPIVEKLARESGGRLRVAKVNVDENPQVAMTYDIRSIPTMMVVQNGRIMDRWAGALPEGAMRGRLARWL